MTKEYDWQNDPELGKIPDTEFAKKVNESVSVVAKVRRKLGIPIYIIYLESLWKNDPDIRQLTDTAFAKKYNVDGATVAYVRKRLGFNKRIHKNPYTNWQNDPELGKIPDAEFAKKVGVTSATVGRVRHRLAIPSYQQWKRSLVENDPDLGKISDEELAKKHGIPLSTAESIRRGFGFSKRRSSKKEKAEKRAKAGAKTETKAEEEPLANEEVSPKTPHIPPGERPRWSWRLGKEPDSWIADELSVNLSTVKGWREKLGIPPCPDGDNGDTQRGLESSPSPAIIPKRREAIDWDAQPLGKVPDCDLAKELGVDYNLVRLARIRRGIPINRIKGGINWDEQPLGEISDKELAKRLNLTTGYIRATRSARGIPPASRRDSEESSEYSQNSSISPRSSNLLPSLVAGSAMYFIMSQKRSKLKKPDSDADLEEEKKGKNDG